ncbi:MAG: 2,4-dihydroxyhept-2-ene-1,7-dioic acid aldolase [Gammaproteobacteria bacterium]|nr:2,4-dihydroxyhept-2-ene-1,7-dioic acid aldolase [Gammaproteobacteria bacterium]MBU2286986.1 2,4-dihydroxyhept-2-ene-1,7-dioic acid aldolase [Gammaproteobacteria bacterium]
MTAGAAFKRKLQSGQPVSVINVDYANAALVEFLARPELRLDAVMLDAEQGSPDFESLEDMARVARLAGLCVLVRIFSPEPWVIERMLLRGVDGIIVPRLDSAEQARAVVDGVRYCYPKDADDKVIVVQIESAAAHADLDAFLATEGIDAYFIGPVDLSRSMGHQGNYSVAPVQAAIDDILQRTRAAGRAAGTMVKPGDADQWVERGARFLYFHVNDWLQIGSRSFPLAPLAAR